MGGSRTWVREMTSFNWSEERSTELDDVVADENSGELHPCCSLNSVPFPLVCNNRHGTDLR